MKFPGAAIVKIIDKLSIVDSKWQIHVQKFYSDIVYELQTKSWF